MNNLPTPEEVERSLYLENFEYENRYTYLRQFAALLREINGQGTPMVNGLDNKIVMTNLDWGQGYDLMFDLAHRLECLLVTARACEQERIDALIVAAFGAGVSPTAEAANKLIDLRAAIRALPSEVA